MHVALDYAADLIFPLPKLDDLDVPPWRKLLKLKPLKVVDKPKPKLSKAEKSWERTMERHRKFRGQV